jgi:hypothetical protein
MEIESVIHGKPVCKPVLDFIDSLIKGGAILESQELRDHHFNEMHFILKVPENFRINPNDLPKGITIDKPNFYTCNCHWSIVELKVSSPIPQGLSNHL